MSIKGEDLKPLVEILASGADEETVNQKYPLIVEWWRQSRTEQTAWQETWPGGLLQFLQDIALGIVRKEWHGTRALPARGLLLWCGLKIAPLLNADLLRKPKVAELPCYFGSGPWWERWVQWSGLPSKTENPFLESRQSTFYNWMEAGRALLAEYLNRMGQEKAAEGRFVPALWERAYREAQASWLAHISDGLSLNEVYVNPRLLTTQKETTHDQGNKETTHDQGNEERTQSRQVETSAESVRQWAQSGEVVVLVGPSGSGKSVLLRQIGKLILKSAGAVLYLESPGQEVQTFGDVARWWCATLNITNEWALPVAQKAVVQRQLVVLVDNGELYTACQRQQLMGWARALGLGVIIATRDNEDSWGAIKRVVQIEWPPDRLRSLMAHGGNDSLWSTLEQWAQQGQLLRRPWEYALAARLQHTSGLKAPLDLLEYALTERLNDWVQAGENRRQVGKYRRALERQAWELVLSETLDWRPASNHARDIVRWGMKARLVEISNDGRARFVHSLWRDYLAACYAVTLDSPEDVVDPLVGVADWQQVLGWAGLQAMESKSKGAAWLQRLAELFGQTMEATWNHSGWLQGAQVLGVWYSAGVTTESVGRGDSLTAVRCQAEQSLLALLRQEVTEWLVREALDKRLGAALLALAPWSPETAAWLMAWVNDKKHLETRRTLSLYLLRAPQIAAVLAETRMVQAYRWPLHWWWAIGQTAHLTAPVLLDFICAMYSRAESKEDWLDRVQAASGALARMGTAEAIRHLKFWLVTEAQRHENDSGDWEYRLRDGISEWSGSSEDFWREMADVLNQAQPVRLWRGVLRGGLQATGPEGTLWLVKLATEEHGTWSEDIWQEVMAGCSQRGDERIIADLAYLWEVAEPAGTCYAWCLAKALWGYDEPGGILKRTETGWVVNWIRQNQWSSVLKLRIATFILRWRDNSEVAALAQEWRSTAERTQDRELLEAALYLLPSAEDTELQAWLADDELRAAALFLAVRMGQWPLVKIFWEEARRQFSFWDLAELIALKRPTESLELLLQVYFEDWHSFRWSILNRFSAGQIDALLPGLLAKKRLDDRLAQKLWYLGTPLALQDVLQDVQQGKARVPSPGHGIDCYRETSWQVLANFVGEAEARQEFERWSVWGALRAQWSVDIAWPWEVAAFFFDRLLDWDKDVREAAWDVLDSVLKQDPGQVWLGRESTYVNGLCSFLKTGDADQRLMALEWLAAMPAPADAALTPLDLRKLLADPNTVLPALIYIRVHRRLELLPDLCDWWQRWEQEARLLNGLAAAAGDWQQPTGEQSARAEQLDSWQSSLIRTLVWLGQAAEIVLNAARWKGVTILGKAHRKAVAGLLLQPAYLSALVAAVEWGMVPATWLSTALAEQGVLLERQPAGEWASRRGARRTSLAAGS